jgi:hypothetical protein
VRVSYPIRFIGILLLMFFLFSTEPMFAAAAPQLSNPSEDPQFGRDRRRDETERKMEHDREKAMNKQRQADIQKDTDRLLRLATELKEYVDKTDEHMLSVDVLKKTDEIDKLAKQIREKMKGSY